MRAESVRDGRMPDACFAARTLQKIRTARTLQKIRIGDAAEEENKEERVWVPPFPR